MDMQVQSLSNICRNILPPWIWFLLNFLVSIFSLGLLFYTHHKPPSWNMLVSNTKIHVFLVSFVTFARLYLCASISETEWQSLNATINGHLHRGTPLSLPCFSTYNGHSVQRDAVACVAIQTNYTLNTFRSPQFGAFMNGQGEICLSNATDQCLLDNTNPNNPIAYTNVSCNQGSVSPYYVEIHSAADVLATFSFAKRTGIRLSVKNSGHDYMGRSSQRGSLALWTRKLTNLSYSSSFVPAGCSANASTPAITTGAGANFDDIYTFAHRQNVTFIGGYAATIGASGGWVMGGGHSILSPVYGLGIDRVLEFTIITPDGVLRTANACQNRNLFWALRGGGGGTFGVVLSSTHKVEPVMPLTAASLSFPATSANVLPFLSLLVNESLRWSSEGWGGHLGSHNLINVTPLLNLTEAKQSLAAVANYTLAHNGTVVIESMPDWYSFYTKYVIPNTASVGTTRIISSRLIPTALFASADGRAQLLDYLAYLLNQGITPYIPVVNPVLVLHEPNATSATPAWRNTLWHLGGGVAWAWNSSVADRKAGVQRLAQLTERAEALTPGSGAYVNEANPWTEDWKEAWWGGNYERLLAVKKRYDPDGLLKCWRCVGFEEEDEKEEPFACLGLLE
ncbi:FAD-binding domain-containing protein [Cenococcum geophilum 1.58]|uniref:FAD-binding domain-containing protein n=1 Tax=Cenococcum geophilum 1.58 TaxID=794803 RepID=UPI00358F1B1B|nr:FAD-binding domain-containing protein [Cenococcum geophilum 1.58]